MSPASSNSARTPGSESRATQAIILAAGMGKRMNSDLPKVLHPIGGRPMVCAVIDACRDAGCDRTILVVGHKHELVRQAIEREYGASHTIEFTIQQPQNGTGHAVRCAEHLFLPLPEGGGRGKGSAVSDAHDVFVLAGDGPLIRAQTLRDLLSRHRSSRAAATLATSIIPDPTGYGRILRDSNHNFAAIVEHKDATPEQLKIREVNPSYYCFDAHALFTTLATVKKNPASGEYYITDVPALLLKQGHRVEVFPGVPADDVLSINDPTQLAQVDAIYRARSLPSKSEIRNPKSEIGRDPSAFRLRPSALEAP